MLEPLNKDMEVHEVQKDADSRAPQGILRPSWVRLLFIGEIAQD